MAEWRSRLIEMIQFRLLKINIIKQQSPEFFRSAELSPEIQNAPEFRLQTTRNLGS
jgi:hypothetical protein